MPGDSPRERFLRDGFYIHPTAVLSADVLARACAGAERVLAGDYEGGEPFSLFPASASHLPRKIEMPHVASPALWDAVTSPELARLAAEVSGGARVQIWWVQLVEKPPRQGGDEFRIGWHQDRQYWSPWDAGSELFTAWIPLCDTFAACGTLRYLRGAAGTGDFLRQDGDAHLAEIAAGVEPVDVRVPAGGASFHDPNNFHGSGPNETAAPRRSLSVHFCTDKKVPRPFRCGSTQFLDDPNYSPVVWP